MPKLAGTVTTVGHMNRASPGDGSVSSRHADGDAGDAAEAAEKAHVAIRCLSSTDDIAAAVALFGELWKAPGGDAPLSGDVLRAFELSGNYVHGAFDSAGRLTGASVAFAAIGEPVELHSHVTGVAESHRRTGVGRALKLHQREWALDRGIEAITWTFDPLVRRNAELNLARLGAQAVRYLENVYGVMSDVLNGEDESDRLLVRWQLEDPAVLIAVAGIPRRVGSASSLPRRLAPGPDGRPTSEPAEGRFRCRVPDHIEDVRRTDPESASLWRAAVRDVIGGAMAGGGRLLGLDRDGAYVVEDGPGR